MKAVRPSTTPLSAPSPRSDASLLAAVLEGFSDGILILTPDQVLYHINQKGKEILRLFQAEGTANPDIPACIQSMCEHMVESQELFPDTHLLLTQSFTCGNDQQIRVRVQWLHLKPGTDPYLLVLLEDQTHATRITALSEAVRYGLTPRETEVWLLRRAQRSYEEIGAELYIAINTVKRHLKSIYAKRKQVMDDLTDSVV